MRQRVFGFVFGCALAAGVLASARPACAQAAPPPPPPPREGSVDFSFLQTTGNSSTQTVGLGGNVINRKGPWEIENRAGFVRNETDDLVKAETFRYRFRALRKINERLSAYGQYDFLRDVPAGVSHRNEVTGGLDFQVYADSRQVLRAFAGLGYAHEDRTGIPVPDPKTLSSAIFDTGWKYTLKLSETADFTDDFRYDASFARSEDWRIGHIAAVTAKLTTLFSMKLTATQRFVNFPPSGLKKTDTTTSVALVAKF